MSDIKLGLGGGIGDCLKLLSFSYPIQDYYDNTGKKTFVSYNGNDCGWETLIKENIVETCMCLEYVDPGEFSKLDLPIAHDFFHNTAGKYERFLPLNINFGENIEIDNEVFNVGIQLQGNDMKKRWEQWKYDYICKYILEKRPNSNIYILDAPETAVNCNFFKDRRIINCIDQTTFLQNIQIISNMDLFISPDSFSKYICRWYRIPQLILMHDVGYLSPEEMLSSCFMGLLWDHDVRLIGCEYFYTDKANIKVNKICKDVKDIQVKEVINKLRLFKYK